MKASFLAVLGTVLLAGVASAADESACMVAAHLVHADFPLPHVAAAIGRNQLTITVLGSASSMLPGAEGVAKAYPARLEDALRHRLAGTTVKVIVHAKARDTVGEMEKTLEKVMMDDKPDLVVWQAGTVDAMMGIDLDTFHSALEDGLDTIQAAKSDALLMNMQYSPRTDSMIALGSYVESMRFVALQREVPLFDRLAVMKNWNEMGIFDLYSPTKKIDIAEKVHDCIGRLLARLIVEGAKLAHVDDIGSGAAGSLQKDLH
jgi:hypothetical protein